MSHISQADGQLDVMAATRLVPSGLSHDMVCAVCGDLLRRDVRTRQAPLYNREKIEAHLAVCPGPKTWKRRLHRIFRPLARTA
ncbi:MAG: hypothetical protein JST61_03000 [Acidobacteria bacterium]|nr:hypothetical protein [Acidobacteriota bacterium]